MEEEHKVKLKEETRRIKAEQERDYHKFLDQVKLKKKEVKCVCVHLSKISSNQFTYSCVYLSPLDSQ